MDSARHPFPEAQGKGVRIAVIDSGVNARHPHVCRVDGGFSIGAPPDAIDLGPSAVREDPSGYSDYLGHGTAVMAAIQEKAPQAEYYAVKLFHHSLRTTATHLLEALDWAIEQRMDVINLSLGTRNPDHEARFAPLVQRASAQGSVVVSAYDTDGVRCFPGSMTGVLGVSLDWECEREEFRSRQTPEGWMFRTSGYPRSLPGMPRERNLSGISFAVANMSGFVARALEALPQRSLTAVTEALAEESLRLSELAER